MILLSELSRRRIRSINKLVRVGRDECAVVVRVDQVSAKNFSFVLVLQKSYYSKQFLALYR